MKSREFVGRMIYKKFLEVKARNKYYSIRAFANQIGISKTYAANILNGSKTITKETLEKIFLKLKFNDEEQSKILKYYNGSKLNSRLETTSEIISINEESIHLLENWYVAAIYSLLQTKDKPKTIEQIAKRLDITTDETEIAINNLLILNLIEKKTNEGYMTKEFVLSSTENVPSAHIKKNHLETMKLAQKSLLNDPIETRDFTNFTFPINTKKIDKARIIIRKFQNELNELFDGCEYDEIYNLSIQFFPISKKV